MSYDKVIMQPPNHLAFRFSRAFLPIAVVLLLLVGTSDVAACPTCKDSLAQNDPAQQAMVRGYFYSILFMMSMPFLLLGTFGGMAFVAIRRGKRAVPHDESRESPGREHHERRSSKSMR